MERRIATYSNGRLTVEAAQVVDDWYQRLAELSWARLRDMQSQSWPMEIEVVGCEHLTAARGDTGRGALLWFQSSCDVLVMFRGLAAAGFPATPLSLSTHGSPGHSRFGEAIVTPLHCVAEDRWIGQRIVMQSSSSPGYVRTLDGCLAAGKVVTLRGDLAMPSGSVSVELFGRPARLARGAPTMAYRNEVELLTSFTTRLGPRRYRVVIEPAVVADRSSRANFVAGALAEYARRLEANVAAHPADWQGWWWVDDLLVEADRVSRP